MTELAKILIAAGAVLLAAGLLLSLFGKLPWLGRLPGDILIERDSFRFYMPITTCLVLSVVLSLLVWLFRR